MISDVHGNGVALDAVLGHLSGAGVDALVCLGDLAQGGAQPEHVVDAVRSLDVEAFFVLGNADDFLLSGVGFGEPITDRQLTVRDWSLRRLGPERCEFLRTFAPTVELELAKGKTLLAFHGSPRSYDDIVLPNASEAEFNAFFGQTDASFLCGGHTHVQWTRRLGPATFFNPGSVGFSRNEPIPEGELRYDPWASYAVLAVEDGTAEIAFRRVSFDPRDVIAAIEASAMPEPSRELELWQAAVAQRMDE